jgi:protein-disulfide isomerase
VKTRVWWVFLTLGIATVLGVGVVGGRLAQVFTPGSSAAVSASPALDVPGIQAIVADYIEKHPEAIVSALDAERARQALLDQSRASAAVHSHLAQLFADRRSPEMGNPRGDVNVAEFFDFRCPYCKLTAPLLEKLVARDSHVRIVFKNLPILGPDSIYAARLGLAAARLGRFTDFYETIFARVPPHSDRAAVDKAVRSLGLDPAALYAAGRTPEIEAAVQRDLRLAADLGISGTPALVVGDQLLPGAPTEAELDAAVKAARRK